MLRKKQQMFTSGYKKSNMKVFSILHLTKHLNEPAGSSDFTSIIYINL